jgi:predicted Zn-ribbon and HTH transcriptional regulator
MYGLESSGSLLVAIIGIAMIIVFFVMASKLSKILDILEFFRDIELKNPENWSQIKCEKCGKEFRVSKALKGTVNCPECKSITRI